MLGRPRDGEYSYLNFRSLFVGRGFRGFGTLYVGTLLAIKSYMVASEGILAFRLNHL